MPTQVSYFDELYPAVDERQPAFLVQMVLNKEKCVSSCKYERSFLRAKISLRVAFFLANIFFDCKLYRYFVKLFHNKSGFRCTVLFNEFIVTLDVLIPVVVSRFLIVMVANLLQLIRIRMFLGFLDPDPYGSGSFYHQTNIVKNLNFYCFFTSL